MKKTFLAFIALTAIIPLFAKPKKSDGKIQKIRVAHTNYYVPYDFVNDKGESDGFEVAVLKEVNKLLPQYEFEYFPTSDDDLLIGVLQGKYDVGTKGVWITEERKKKYIFPQNPIAASIIGIVIRKDTADKITDIKSFAKYSGKLVPIGPSNAQYNIIDEYNKQNPDARVDIKLSFQNNIEKEGAPYAKYKDNLSYVPYKAIPTWPLFNRKNQAFANAYDEAIKTLKENGTLEKLSQKYFGENIFSFVE